MIEKETGGVVLLYIHILFYKGTFSGESMQQRKRTDTLVLDESISELSGSHAQINKTIAAVTFCCQIKKQFPTWVCPSSLSQEVSSCPAFLIYSFSNRRGVDSGTQIGSFSLLGRVVYSSGDGSVEGLHVGQ